MAKIGVLLAGCGNRDGSEIHEAVLTMLFLDQKGATTVCMAPNSNQREVFNHLTGQPTQETRNILVESARIARGNIHDVADVSAQDIDGLIIPGGAGAAKNLSDFAVSADVTVTPDVESLIRDLIHAEKPIGAICIAPATLACAIGDKAPEVTIGDEAGTAKKIESVGAKHIKCTVDMIHVDKKNRLVTTPAYMLGPGIKDIAVGIEKLVEKVLFLA